MSSLPLAYISLPTFHTCLSSITCLWIFNTTSVTLQYLVCFFKYYWPIHAWPVNRPIFTQIFRVNCIRHAWGICWVSAFFFGSYPYLWPLLKWWAWVTMNCHRSPLLGHLCLDQEWDTSSGEPIHRPIYGRPKLWRAKLTGLVEKASPEKTRMLQTYGAKWKWWTMWPQ